MPDRRDEEWDVQLSDDGDYLRFRLLKENGKIVDFVVQFEVTIDDKRVPVIRYDGSHPICHYDRYNHQGRKVEQRWLDSGLAIRDCLSKGQQDLRKSWKQHRARFFGERR